VISAPGPLGPVGDRFYRDGHEERARRSLSTLGRRRAGTGRQPFGRPAQTRRLSSSAEPCVTGGPEQRSRKLPKVLSRVRHGWGSHRVNFHHTPSEHYVCFIPNRQLSGPPTPRAPGRGTRQQVRRRVGISIAVERRQDRFRPTPYGHPDPKMTHPAPSHTGNRSGPQRYYRVSNSN
jgi:hypothetical protein